MAQTGPHHSAPAMRLDDILYCFDLGESPPQRAESLLRAYLAGLLYAVDYGHLSHDVAKRFVSALEARWLAQESVKPKPHGGADFARQGIEALWNDFGALLRGLEGSMCLLHCGALNGESDLDDPADAPLVSVLDDRVFKFWLRDEVPGIRFPEQGQAADILDLIDACKDQALIRDGAMVGRPNSVVWLTPGSGEIGALIGKAQHIMKMGLGASLEKMPIADTIRNRLGLWESDGSRHGIAVIFRRRYSELVGDSAMKLRAPTIFDAEGYPRFRHWPSPTSVPHDPMGRGRTYELDPAIRRNKRPGDGAPEIVAPTRPFEEVEQIVYLGRFSTPPDKGETEAEKRASAEFADMVAGDNISLSEIVVALAKLLELT
jgi:hypothetical protein